MNQNNQQLTPETDKAVGEWNPELHDVVTAFFARNLEAMRKTLIESEAYQAGLVADIEAMREAIKEAHEALKAEAEAYCHVPPNFLLSALAKLQPFIQPKP